MLSIYSFSFSFIDYFLFLLALYPEYLNKKQGESYHHFFVYIAENSMCSIMSYSEQDLNQALVKLYTVINAKITNSTTPNPVDFEFLAHLGSYRKNMTRNDPQRQKKENNVQAQLRSFLRKAKLWEKMETSLLDVSIIKVPLKIKNVTALRLVITHMKRELDITTDQAFQKLKGIFTDARVNSLMKEIDQVNKIRVEANN
jgi:hypothetical protein